MKISKKIFTGLGLALLIASLAVMFSHRALAAGPITSDQLDNATYSFTLLNSFPIYPKNISANIGGATIQFTDNDNTDSDHNYKPKDKTLFCDGTLFGNNDEGEAFKGVTLSSGSNDSITGNVNIDYLDASGTCQNYQNSLTFTKQADGSYQAKEQPAGSNSSQGTDNDTCEANSGGSPLAWITCPLITAASDAITGENGQGGLLGYFEGQLSFSVSKDLGPTKTQDQVKVTWGIFKNIATAILVVVMLLMVYSQATGGGPFDAYTTRKMLPRLVAIAIAMQLSWVLLSWIIDLFNDAGNGLADLMYAPFGGSSNLTIFSLLSNANLGTSGAIIINWVGIMALLAIGVAAPFIVLAFAFGAAAGLLTAFFVLIFRKIIIILCLITAPLAFAAYLLPGLQRYWKLWLDNFIKVLAMFPLIVALIAAGRIFGYIVSTQNNGGVLVSFILIIVGFFGPLFLLPKAFKWGGQLMNVAGTGIMNATTKASERPKKFMQSRQEGYAAERRQQSQKRYSKNQGVELNRNFRRGFGIPSLWRRPLDLARAGELDPTLWGRRSQKAQDTYVSQGVASQAEDIKAASDRIRRVEEQLNEGATRDAATGRALNKDDFWQDVAMGIDREYRTYDGKVIRTSEFTNPTERRAAMDRMAVLGGQTNFRAIEQMYDAAMTSGDADRQAEMRNYLNDNVQTLLPKMGHLYKGVMSMADSSPDGIAEMHGVEVEAILGGLSSRIADLSRPMSERRAAQRSLNTFLASYRAAMESPALRGRLELGGTRAVKGFLSTNRAVGDYQLRRINQDSRDGRQRRTYTRVDPATGLTVTETMTPLPNAHSNPDLIGAVDPTLTTYLDTHIADDGGLKS